MAAELPIFTCPHCGTRRAARSLAEFEDHYCWNKPSTAVSEAKEQFRERQWARDFLGQSQARISATQRLVGLAIMLHADWQTLEAFPGQEVLASECGLSRRTVWAAIQRLKKSGWLHRVRKGDSRNGKAEVLRLNWPAWFDATTRK